MMNTAGSGRNFLASFIKCRIIDLPAMPITLEVVSKPQIRFKGKAQADRESAAYVGM
jgi:hypothetical protein